MNLLPDQRRIDLGARVIVAGSTGAMQGVDIGVIDQRAGTGGAQNRVVTGMAAVAIDVDHPVIVGGDGVVSRGTVGVAVIAGKVTRIGWGNIAPDIAIPISKRESATVVAVIMTRRADDS